MRKDGRGNLMKRWKTPEIHIYTYTHSHTQIHIQAGKEYCVRVSICKSIQHCTIRTQHHTPTQIAVYPRNARVLQKINTIHQFNILKMEKNHTFISTDS